MNLIYSDSIIPSRVDFTSIPDSTFLQIIFSRFNFNLFSFIQTITKIRKCSRILIASLETEGTGLLSVISILMGFQSKTPSDLLKQFHDDDKQHKRQNKTSDTTTDNDLAVEQ